MSIKIKCKECNRIKEYDKWVYVPKEIETLLENSNILYVTCDDCRYNK